MLGVDLNVCASFFKKQAPHENTPPARLIALKAQQQMALVYSEVTPVRGRAGVSLLQVLANVFVNVRRPSGLRFPGARFCAAG